MNLKKILEIKKRTENAENFSAEVLREKPFNSKIYLDFFLSS